MQVTRATGQGAASKKYDVLTAIGAHACAGDKHRQRLCLRFLTIVTARYNWQRDELRVGRAEMARLWQVDERTVKRDLAKLKAAGWLCVRQAAARGRVTVYGVDWGTVLADTSGAWAHVGPDFAARLAEMTGRAVQDAAVADTVVPFPQAPRGEGDWARARALLHRTDPAFDASWLAPLVRDGVGQGILTLRAPTAFHAQYVMTHAIDRITRAVAEVAPNVHRVVVLGPARGPGSGG